MNGAYIALIGTLATVVGAILSPIIMRLLGRDENRADIASKFQQIASDAGDDMIAQRAELRALRTAVEALVEAVDAISPVIREEHPQCAETLREAVSAVRNAL